MCGGNKMKQKGFIFTIDALAAVTIIVALAIAWATGARAKISEKSYYESMEKIARDETVVALYKNVLSNDDISAIYNENFYVCSKYFKLDPNSDATPTSVDVYKKCFASTMVS